MVNVIFCKRCGAKNPREARFCAQCGATLREAAVPAAAAPDEAPVASTPPPGRRVRHRPRPVTARTTTYSLPGAVQF